MRRRTATDIGDRVCRWGRGSCLYLFFSRPHGRQPCRRPAAACREAVSRSDGYRPARHADPIHRCDGRHPGGGARRGVSENCRAPGRIGRRRGGSRCATGQVDCPDCQCRVPGPASPRRLPRSRRCKRSGHRCNPARLPEEIAQSVRRGWTHTRAELANAEGFADRTRGMVERGLQSTQELEDATRRLRQARATHNSASQRLQLLRTGARIEARQALQARLRAAQAAHELAVIELQHTVIASPMDGIVSHRHVDRVRLRQNDGHAHCNDRGDADRPDRSAHQRAGHRGGASRPQGADRGRRVRGRAVSRDGPKRLAPTVDPSSRSGEVEIALPNADYRLKPGHVCENYAAPGGAREGVVLVPRGRPCGRTGSETMVFVVRDGIGPPAAGQHRVDE